MKWSFWEKGKISQKKLLWGVIGFAAVTLLYSYGVVPLLDAKKAADIKLVQMQKQMLHYNEILQNRKEVEEDLALALKESEEAQKKLLPGETPQLGAANLQDIVKKISEKNSIGFRSFRILEPKEINIYRKISLQIEFNPIGSMRSLSQFLEDLEHQEKEMVISEMELLIFNPRMPTQIQGSLVVSGFMRGSKEKKGEK